MNAFLAFRLYFLAGCAVIGMAPALVLAAKARSIAAAMTALLVAVFVIGTLISAAGDLR